jgi:hypothetical protein
MKKGKGEGKKKETTEEGRRVAGRKKAGKEARGGIEKMAELRAGWLYYYERHHGRP